LVYHAPLRMSSIYSPAPHSPTFFSFNPPAPPHTYTLSLHDALPISPARPQGRERNVVVSMWDWADPKVYLHDEIGTDKRNPTVKDRKSTRLNSSHVEISYAVFCLKKKKKDSYKNDNYEWSCML